MKIEEGKFYKMRNGRVVGPMEWTTDDANSSCWVANNYQSHEAVDGYAGLWSEDGTECFFYVGTSDPQYDLVEAVEQ